MGYENDLLRVLINLTGRLVFPEEQLAEMFPKGKTKKKYVKAYNLCDGTRSQNEISKEAKIDQGNFSRTVNRWLTLGIIYKIGEGNDSKLLHIYPVSEDLINKKK